MVEGTLQLTDEGRPRAGRQTAVVTPLDESTSLALLPQAKLGRVALCMGALPCVRAVRFAVDGDAIVIRLRPDSRLRKATAGMVVAFEADHYDEAARGWWSVEVCGIASAVSDPVELARLRTLPLEPWTEPD